MQRQCGIQNKQMPPIIHLYIIQEELTLAFLYTVA